MANERGGRGMAEIEIAGPEISPEEIRRRFAWARRQGRPAWLWPDVGLEAWKFAMGQIETAVMATLAKKRIVRLEGDATSLGLAGYTSGVGPLLGFWIEHGHLAADPAIADMFALHLVHNRVRSGRMTAAAADLVRQFANAGIQSLVLKGAHTALAYFPELGVRPASDIDLLVSAHDVQNAEAVLTAAGLTCKGRTQRESTWVEPTNRSQLRSLTYVHAENPWSVDLHNSLAASVGWGAVLADFDRADPMASAQRWPVDPSAAVLDQPLLLLHLAAHAGAGWQNLTLLRQVELVFVIRQEVATGRLNWDAFLDVGARTEALGYAYPALCLAEKLAPGVVPEFVLSHCAGRAPGPVRRALEQLTPATAQRMDRASIGEHFMWANGWPGLLRMLAFDLLPAPRTLPEILKVYEARAWRLVRGRVSK